RRKKPSAAAGCPAADHARPVNAPEPWRTIAMRRLAWVSALAALACAPKPDPERIKLLRHLRDARPAARIVAIQQLAPHANREETAAIARAAEDMTSDVRKAVALALAKSDAEIADDLIA